MPLLQDCAVPAMPTYAVYPSRRHRSAKVRVFVDDLAERFAGSLDWVPDAPPAANMRP